MWFSDFISTFLLFLLFHVGVALFIFSLIGIHKVYSDYKESKWQKEYGNKLKKETDRNKWEKVERLRDKVFLLEEIIKINKLANTIDKIDVIISDVNYDVRYNDYKENEDKWNVFAITMMGVSEKAQADVQGGFDKYEEQRKQELRRVAEMIWVGE